MRQWVILDYPFLQLYRFSLRSETNKQKAAKILDATKPNVVTESSDVIRTMPSSDDYPFIKIKIIEHFADSERWQLSRLFSEMS